MFAPVNKVTKFFRQKLRRRFRLRHPLHVYFVGAFGGRLLGRFILLNVLGITSFIGGLLILSESRQTLSNAYGESLHLQAQIIAGALSQSMSDREYDEQIFSDDAITDGWQVREAIRIVQRIGYVTPSRVRLYSRSGRLILDSAYVSRTDEQFDANAAEATEDSQNNIIARPLRPLSARELQTQPSLWQKFLRGLVAAPPILNEVIAADGLALAEVAQALAGNAALAARQAPNGGDILTVAVPVHGYRQVIGALMVSTPPGQIDKLIAAERRNVFELTFIAALVTLAVSLVMAATVIIPIRRLSRAMRRFSRSVSQADIDAIPDYSERGDEVAYLSATLRDIAKRLLQRITMISSFAADVAHELKNPLTSLHSGVQTLAQTNDSETREKLNQIIDHDVKRLNHLISEIANASRLDAELGVDDSETFDLNTLAEDMGEALAHLYREQNGVELIVRTDRNGDRGEAAEVAANPHAAFVRGNPHAALVRGNPQRIAQIIDNLLSNAASLSAQEAKIFLTTHIKEAEVELIVTDEGPGLRAGVEEKIFERFYRDRPAAAKAETQNDKNKISSLHSGLGLSISRQIAQAYGGNLTAQNRSDASGAYFTLTLPLAEISEEE